MKSTKNGKSNKPTNPPHGGGFTRRKPMTEPHEVEKLEERVRDLERQLVQGRVEHINEMAILKHDLMRANLKARLKLQDEIAARKTARREAQFSD
jgi:wobble nucleotide-excising tRNase